MDRASITFAGLGIDPLEGSEIMNLIGASELDLRIPKRFEQIRRIVKHFQGDSGKRFRILKIIQKSMGRDGIDALFNYVQLSEEKGNLIKNLNPDEFEKDIAKEIVDGYMTKDKIKRIKKDIDERRKNQIRQAKKEKNSESEDNYKIDEATTLTNVEETVDQLELVNQALQYFE